MEEVGRAEDFAGDVRRVTLPGSFHGFGATIGVSVGLEWGEACRLTLYTCTSRVLREVFVNFYHCAKQRRILPVIACG